MSILLFIGFAVGGYFLYHALKGRGNSSSSNFIENSERKEFMNSSVKKIIESPNSDSGFDELAKITQNDSYEKREAKIKESVQDIVKAKIDKYGISALVSMIRTNYEIHNISSLEVSHQGNELIFNRVDREIVDSYNAIKEILIYEHRYSEKDVNNAKRFMSILKESDLKAFKTQEQESRAMFLRAGVSKWTFQVGGNITSSFDYK